MEEYQKGMGPIWQRTERVHRNDRFEKSERLQDCGYLENVDILKM